MIRNKNGNIWKKNLIVSNENNSIKPVEMLYQDAVPT